MTGLLVIVYNIHHELFLLQRKSIEKYCKGDYELVVIDNSSDSVMSDAIRHHSEGLRYLKTNIDADASHSHAYAANYSFNLFYHEFDEFMYLDHDCIPYKDFSFESLINGKDAFGVEQGFDVKYFWAGCVGWTKKIPRELINFNPSLSNRTDTGGGFYRVLQKFACEYLEQKGVKNELYQDEFYDFYTTIQDTFIHFINTSNWRNVEGNERRIQSLIEICQTLQS